MRSVFVATLCFGFLSAEGQEKLFTLLPADSTGVDFNNIINDTKQLNVISYEYYYNGSGVAIGDVNNDGLPDLYFTSNVYDCKLYLNQGNLKFKDVTKEAGVYGNGGYKTGVVMVDINNDGWMDIYVCRSVLAEPKYRRNLLYVNNKDGTFTDRAVAYGIADEGFSMQAAFNDMDGDGDLDLLVLNHPYNLNFAKTVHLTYNKNNVLEAVRDSATPFESDRYYENVNGKYVDHTKSAGLETRAFGLSAVLEDFNGDGLLDIYQANDYLEPDYLFINKGKNKFVNEHGKYFGHCSYSSMGSDFADINNDGLSDLITVDMLPEGNQRQKQLRRGNNYDEFEKLVKYGYGYQYVKNTLHLNNGNGSFSDISYYTGTAFSDWSWGVLMNDFDNDGLKDIYIANGYRRDITDMDYAKYSMDSIQKEMIKTKTDDDVVKLLSLIPSVKVRKSYFKNYGDLDFRKESKESGMDQNAWSFGAAYADLDNDGDLEIVVCNVDDNAFIYRNNTVENHWGKSVRVQLSGPPKNVNGIGTKIVSTSPDGLKTTTTYNPMKGYLSSHDKTMVLGIGKNESTNLLVTWPDGKQQELTNVSTSELHVIRYSDAQPPAAKEVEHKQMFEDVTAKSQLKYTYTENEYIDFKLEPLLPRRFSQMGPCITVADFNGDHLDDVFVGGAKDRSASIYFQDSDGRFTNSTQTAFVADKAYEDGASEATDLDNDGDLDLVVTCGGNEYPNNEKKYPVRFYLNNGMGIFSKGNSSNKFFTSSTSLAIADLDNNGTKEIFVGGRVVPGHYGLIPKSYLLTVQGDSVIDITSTTKLANIGMVSTALFKDMNKDGLLDLVLAGEWMPVMIALNQKGRLTEAKISLDNTNGWWNHLICVDIDHDGDEDIVGGNLGLNSRYRGTVEHPVTMVVSDFDENGSTDCIISVFSKNESYPIAVRDYVLDQMPYLKKKYLRYRQYSTATVKDMFTQEQLEKAENFSANEMHSAIFYNDGAANFKMSLLPPEAQLFPVYGIVATDVNADGITDLLLSGNEYATEVETGRCDAGIGLVLLGDGSAKFKAVPVTSSGFYTPGDVKAMEGIRIHGEECVVVGKNKGAIQLLGFTHPSK